MKISEPALSVPVALSVIFSGRIGGFSNQLTGHVRISYFSRLSAPDKNLINQGFCVLWEMNLMMEVGIANILQHFFTTMKSTIPLLNVVNT